MMIIIRYIVKVMQPGQKFQYAVIGAGVYGLSVAYHLAKNNYSVALLQKYTIGHDNGSSHGSTRISSSLYTSKFYTNLQKAAMNTFWPQIEKELETKFLFKNQMIWMFGDNKIYEDFHANINEQGDKQFIPLNQQDLDNRYPNFPQKLPSEKIILQKDAAIINAELYCTKIEEYLRSNPNVMIFENTDVTEIRQSSKTVQIEIQSEIFSANKIIVTCGRWLTNLVPELNDLVHVVPQTVAYLKMNDSFRYQVGRFPSFAHLTTDQIYYGLPDIKHNGIKFSEHRTKKYYQNAQILEKKLTNKAQQIFKEKLLKISSFETCYYTMTRNKYFIIDWADPEKERVLICSCCSGHGFKFAPLMGKIISDLVIENKSIELFEAHRHLFQIQYHRGVNLY